MPTVADILKQSGLSDDQIAAIDAKAMSALNGVYTTAEQARAEAAQKEAAALAAGTKAESDRKIAVESAEAARIAQEKAELESRSTKAFWDETYTPGVNAWETERQKLLQDKINAEAQAAFMKAQNDGARAAGFLPADAPSYTPTTPTTPARDTGGRFVPGAQGGTPGSPTFTEDDIKKGFSTVLGTIPDLQWRHQTLYGKPMPISPTDLIKQAEAVRMSPAEYAAKTFRFSERQQELANQEKEAELAKVRAEAIAPMQAQIEAEKAAAAKAVADNDKKWAEKIGNNPDVRIAQPSRFADVTRAVKAGERPDPTKMNEAARRKATHQAIMSEISEAQQVA